MNTHSFGVFKVDNDHWEGVDGQDEDVEDVESEVFDVEKPNAVVCPWTMMVHLDDATLADTMHIIER